MLTNTLLSTLCEMLTYCRPHGSPTDDLFRARFLLNLPHATVDAHRNIHVRIGTSPILWSAHTDTVHYEDGRQTLHIRRHSIGLSKKARKGGSNCLGADDTIGCFILRTMIQRGVPGHYVFHYGEESGGIGSSALASLSPELLDGAQIAIALDRKGTRDVITHQMHSRTCSDAFAISLCDALRDVDPKFAPSDGGIYTDTAEYADVIPECTNVSVGYDGAHTAGEDVNTSHVARLLDALCALDQASLVVERDPKVREEKTYTRYTRTRGGNTWAGVDWSYTDRDRWSRTFGWESDLVGAGSHPRHYDPVPGVRVITPRSTPDTWTRADGNKLWTSRATAGVNAGREIGFTSPRTVGEDDCAWCQHCRDWVDTMRGYLGALTCAECGTECEPLTESDRRLARALRNL